MGQYKKSTLTAAGERLVAQAIGGEIKLNITKVKTSNHQYPDGTNFKSLVDMDGIVQTMVGPKTAVYNDTLIQTRALFSNEEVKETYYIHNIGLYAMDGSEEVLFSISSATTPDEMPKYDGVAPTTCIYNIQNTISETSSVSLTINPAGYASIADIMELDEKKVDKTGDISETTINALDEPATDVQFPVPVAGESTKTFLGKVKKFFEDTKNWMTGVCLIGQIVNNCVTNNAKLPLSAAQGKVLMDLYTVLNTNKAPNSDFTVGENYIFFKGIKICWGNARLEVTKGANNSATQTISFPITFFEVRVYHSQTADTYDGSIKGMVIRGNSNSFIMQGRVWQDTAQNPVYAYNWVAIGR